MQRLWLIPAVILVLAVGATAAPASLISEPHASGGPFDLTRTATNTASGGQIVELTFSY